MTKLWSRLVWQPRLSFRLWPFVPLSVLYRLLAAFRRWRAGNPHQPLGVRAPVIVIGNITYGGSGKTPVVQALAAGLISRGYRVGIVSRGYPVSPKEPQLIHAASHPAQVGDEPLMLYQTTGCPVCVCRDRQRAVETLFDANPVDWILSDDGLQHYRMARWFEVALVDARRQLGNRWCLPAGPLRELPSRLAEVDAVWECVPHAPSAPNQYTVKPTWVYPIGQPDKAMPWEAWCEAHQAKPLVAMAGIAHPDRYFDVLKKAGLTLAEERVFPDHAEFSARDLVVLPGQVIVMTEKDAVKCESIAPDNSWVIAVRAALPDSWVDALVDKRNKEWHEPRSQATRNPRVPHLQGQPDPR